MPINWKKRLEQDPSLADFENWPYIDSSTIHHTKKKKFNRNRRIIECVLKGQPLKEIARQFSISSSSISYLLNRSLGGEEIQNPPLTSALIPGHHIKVHERKQPLSRLSNKTGESCSFSYLLETVPNLKEKLDEMLQASIKGKAYGQNLKPGIFHSEFKRLLIEANWSTSRYPFNQDYQGYESVRKYFHKRMNELLMPKPKKTKRVDIMRHLPKLAFQEIQIDSQLQDLTTSFHLTLNNELKSLRLSRVALLIAKDVATDCILSYHLCMSKDPNQFDVIELLRKIHRPWVPLELKTPGLKYEPSANFPASLGEEYQQAGLGIVKLDNALCHVAKSVSNYICNQLGATLNLGLPGQPKGRNFVEYAFKLMSDHTHRFPSTTGSNTSDPIRETKKNSKHPPVLTIDAFEEILSVLISAHNTKTQSRLGGESPLTIMQYQMERFPLQISFREHAQNTEKYLRKNDVYVKWNKNENRDPYINFQYARYYGSGLKNANLVAQKIDIHYDPSDIRSVIATTKQGLELGQLYVEGSWRHFPHSITTRSRIKKLVKDERFKGMDPLAGYFSYLLENKELPKHATELVRIVREFGLKDNTSSDFVPTHSLRRKKLPFTRFSKSPKRIPTWTPNFTKMESRK